MNLVYKFFKIYNYLFFNTYNFYKIITTKKKKTKKFNNIKGFSKAKGRLYFWRKIFNYNYLNQNVKPYGDDFIFDKLFLEKLNYVLIQCLFKFLLNFVKNIKFKIKM